jgi:hypothetical protein
LLLNYAAASQICSSSRAEVIPVYSETGRARYSGTDQGLVRDDDANASFTAAESFDQRKPMSYPRIALISFDRWTVCGWGRWAFGRQYQRA